MKIAFICEGDSEHDSLPTLIPKLGLSGYEFLRRPEDLPSFGNIGIYRGNYKSVGKVLKQELGQDGKTRRHFLIEAIFLIYSRGFDRVIVWFDNEYVDAVCNQARQLRKEIEEVEGSEISKKITLIIANAKIENWYLSNKETFLSLFSISEAEMEVSCAGILNRENVDGLKLGACLVGLSEYVTRSKYSVACDFFKKFDPDKEQKSHSLRRAITKIRDSFSALSNPQ